MERRLSLISEIALENLLGSLYWMTNTTFASFKRILSQIQDILEVISVIYRLLVFYISIVAIYSVGLSRSNVLISAQLR